MLRVRELTRRRVHGGRHRAGLYDVDGDLPGGQVPGRALAVPDDAAGLARYVAMVSYGISVRASGGATPDDLHRVVDVALGSWPR
ncbi:hypothetical protein [Streptomyces syringium]|uniref:hypothetical protein n=1 Tax=Streptomyces syringium TaxID=76729 RepID=UPI0033B52594